MRVLIVEDDDTVRRLVGGHLAQQGMSITAAATVAETRHALCRQAVDVVILDIALPGGSALDVLHDLLGSRSTAHVIVLSGSAAEDDRVEALELGADDYVIKPFFPRELAARVRAVARRRDRRRDSIVRAGHLEIDLTARLVTASGGPVRLTAKEFDLLAFLAARPGQVFSRGELLGAVWNSASDWQQATTVTEHVRRLRTKIELKPEQPQLLLTVRGVGYRFDLPTVDPLPPLGPSRREMPTRTLVHVESTSSR